jgi:hypothetical protein
LPMRSVLHSVENVEYAHVLSLSVEPMNVA